jgi:hypothetical protein
MSFNLYKASNQWSTRPADERFETVQDLYAATVGYRNAAAEATLDLKQLRVEAIDGEVSLVGRANNPARLTHWSFGQIASRVSAPAAYLRTLPATLAAQNLNHGLAKGGEGNAKALFHSNGSLVLRCLTSDQYTRIWNSDVAQRLQDLPEGWRVPPARPVNAGQPGTRIATEADVIASGHRGLGIKVGDTIAPAGLYASDHDLFGFFINEDRRIAEPGNPEGLSRGFFVWNSEVGASAFGVTTFLYRSVCGNHIVWDASNVSEIRIIHKGQANARAFEGLRAELTRYADDSASDIEARIKVARSYSLGQTKDDVLDAVFGKKINGLTRGVIEQAYDLAEEHTDTDGSPRTVWGLVQGLTRASQVTPYADERVRIDKAANKVLQIAF